MDTLSEAKLGKVAVEEVERCRKELRDSLVAVSPIFNEKPFFMSEEFTPGDCLSGSDPWRLPALGVELPERSVQAADEVHAEPVRARCVPGEPVRR